MARALRPPVSALLLSALALLLGCPGGKGRGDEGSSPGDTGVSGWDHRCVAWRDGDGDRYIPFDAPCWHADDGPTPDNYTDWWDTGTFAYSELEDCDDADGRTFPWAPEVPYDGVDQDCLGMWDEYDHDLDGHDAAEWGGDDCADDSPLAHPGGLEWLGDAIDGDCDGEVDEPPGGLAVSLDGQPAVIGDEITGRFGGAIALFDTAGDGQVGFVAEHRASDWSQEVVVVSTIGDGRVGELATATIADASLAAPPADVNGDGVEDLLLVGTGEVGIFLGPVLADRTWKESAWGTYGSLLAGIGDATDDGLGDFLVWPKVFAATPGGSPVEVATFDIDQQGDLAPAGDIDGDGLGDVLVKVDTVTQVVLAPFPDTVGADSLAGPLPGPCILIGRAMGDVDGDGRGDLACLVDQGDNLHPRLTMDPLGPDPLTVDLQPDGLRFGWEYGTVGDTDGDGRDEVWVEHYGVVLFLPPFEGSQSAVEDGRWVTLPTGWTFDASAAGGRDLDGDGRDDFLVAFPDLEEERGAVVVGQTGL